MRTGTSDSRIAQILNIMELRKNARLESLAEKLNVGTKTIRNDIRELNQILDGSALVESASGRYMLFILDEKKFQEKKQEVITKEKLDFIHHNKTAALIEAALAVGGILSGASDTEVQKLELVARKIGLAFQIQDDILDVYGDPATFGKAIGGDILCNKKTYMLLTALQRAEGETRRALQGWMADTTHSAAEKIAAVTDLYTQLGVREVCERVMAEHTHEALRLLETLPQNEATDQLHALAEKLMKRRE